MGTYTINMLDNDGALIGTDTIEAKTEQAALNAARKAIKQAGFNPKDYQFQIALPENTATPDKQSATIENPTDELKIILSPANSPMLPGEPKRIYPPSIKTDLGTFWGCDQAKLLDTLRLNPLALDSYQMRTTGTRANFYLGTTLIWTTTKPIAAYANELALQLINELKSA
jgi:hypothetical protein